MNWRNKRLQITFACTKWKNWF